jgi:hypothetical protein
MFGPCWCPNDTRMKSEIESFGGVVEKFIGDAVMAVFGAPVSHGDDAERAVRAGLRVLEAIQELAARLVLGRALMALGHPERGLDQLRTALDGIRRLGHPPTLWRAWSILGTALAQTRRDDEAAAAVSAAANTLRTFAATLAPERSGPLLAAEPSREILSAAGSS